MKHTSKLWLSLVIGLAFMSAGCSKNQTHQSATSTSDDSASTTGIVEPQTDDQLAQDTALNNPATVYCLQQGGKFNMRKNLLGSTEGFCTLPDNVTCEVWAMYKGDCPAGSKKTAAATSTEQADQAASSTTSADRNSLDDATSTPGGRAVDDTVLDETTDSSSQSGTTDKNQQTNISNDVTGQQLTITSEPGDPGEIVTDWKTRGLQADDGFIIMLSGSPDVTYPAKYSHVLQNPQSRSFTWTNLVTGRIYYFRVCIAQGEGCGIYSGVVSSTAP